MKELILKDLELCRGPLIVCLGCFFGPYLFWCVYMACTYGFSGNDAREIWSLGILAASTTSVTLAIVGVAILTGFVVAGERRDRSSEFLAYLPASRGRILLSKGLVCFGWIAAYLLAHPLIIDVFVPWLSLGEQQLTGDRGTGVMITCSLAILGGSWFGTCALKSPTLAFGLGILTVPFSYFFVGGLSVYVDWFDDQETALMFCSWPQVLIGVAGLILGSLIYMKRVEP